MKFFARLKLCFLCAAMLCGLAGCAAQEEPPGERIVVQLAAPRNAMIEDFDTNEYKLWLEEQTGLIIEMTWLPEAAAEQMANVALMTGENLPDAYIGFGSHNIFKQPNLQMYIDIGTVIPLDGYIEQYGENTRAAFEHLKDFYVKELMTQSDGHVYFMPGFTYHMITRYSQILWMNQAWLDALNLKQPATTDDLYNVLKAFRDNDPNGNGIADEIPMAGTDAYTKQPYDNIMNAFVYNDPKNARLYVEDGKVLFAPVTDAWREGLAYLNMLHGEGLYSPLSFTQDDNQMIQMANDRRDILGAFTVSGYTYTVMQSDAEAMRRYKPVAPLRGPEGVQLCTLSFPLPKPNGVITSACEHPVEVFKLFDLMLSEEASMWSFGQQGVDWDYAAPGDMSIFNTPATIRIHNQLWKEKQNKHLMEIEPYIRWLNTVDVTPVGTGEFDGEYINAQARLLYVPYEPEDRLLTLMFDADNMVELSNIRGAIDAHILSGLADFITGAKDIHDDAAWAAYKAEFDSIGLERFLVAAQKSYERFN